MRRILVLCMALMVSASCKNNEKECSKLSEELNEANLKAARKATEDDDAKAREFWVGVSNDAEKGRAACEAAENSRKAAVLEKLVEKAKDEVANLDLKPEFEKWQSEACAYGGVTPPKLAECCATSPLEWKRGKCVEVAESFARFIQWPGEVCSKLAGTKCKRSKFKNGVATTIWDADDWSVWYCADKTCGQGARDMRGRTQRMGGGEIWVRNTAWFLVYHPKRPSDEQIKLAEKLLYEDPDAPK